VVRKTLGFLGAVAGLPSAAARQGQSFPFLPIEHDPARFGFQLGLSPKLKVGGLTGAIGPSSPTTSPGIELVQVHTFDQGARPG